ncbi:hypothetical protein GDO81_009814 [Engystomops pustulosus]|uniref:Meiotic recombination protein REC114 n=1 Tax=Engystomops pustulosus TaxID=76066 RepID=A0AAV7BU67_ENGPU|nr:hypothetical protein GDO81_009814 [Engystomops pustulosus]KAG8576253.1 hypothetical protein GDO81_009814 [Engystomops pustulosus]
MRSAQLTHTAPSQRLSRLCGVMAEAAGGGTSQSCDPATPTDLRGIEQGESWILKKYGRVGRPRDKDKHQPQKRVYESNGESGSITLTILNTGHFFIYQGQTLLEGFSLISAKSWLKIEKKFDWLLFGSGIKEEFRVFRVQFAGDSKDKAQEKCDICFQKINNFLHIQNESVQESSQGISEQGHRITMTQMAQGIVSKQVNGADTINVYHPLNEELCSFLRLCLLDQNFPGFVEAVEKELYKLIKN